MNNDILKSLQKEGVDIRFVSIIQNKIFINNLKLSHFSRKKEELFKDRHPEIEIIRSKIFQKICTRASRNLARDLRPREKIFLVSDDKVLNFALHVILEPYQRKYGIKLIFGSDISEAQDLDVDSIACALTLDAEAVNIINSMLEGQKIELLSSNDYLDDKKMIYPLINVPEEWIYAWTDCKPSNISKNKPSEEFLLFLECIIPHAKENLYKSALFISP